ncbi:MAG: PKD domain-containing protein [Myxococcales bacterium]|nr:PKD domain-containing protein [Myxococcales bacterium]
MNRTILSVAALAALAVACIERRELPPSHPDVAAAPEHRRFLEWTERYFAAEAPARSELEEEGRLLARSRLLELHELIASDPERALSASLSPKLAAELPESVRTGLERRIDAVARWDVIGVWFEGEPAADAELIRHYAVVAGERFRAFTFGRRLSVRSKERLRLHGIAVDGRMAVSESPLRPLEMGEEPELPRIGPRGCAVEEALAYHAGDAVHLLCSQREAKDLKDALEGEELSPNPAGPQASPWTTGQKKLLYLRVDFTDAPGDPLTLAQAQQYATDLNNHFKASSFNKMSVMATFPSTLRMPQPKSWYDGNGADTQLMQDARSAASNAGYVGTSYDLDVVAFQKMPSWGWAGQGYIGQRGTWLNGSFGLRTSAHELGHNLGLYHANFWQASGETIIGNGYSVEYGNPYEIMGGGSGHYNAWYKSDLDWLSPAEVASITSSNAFRIFDLEAYTVGGLKALAVPISASKAYWVEFRPQGGGSLQNGASINWGYSVAKSSNLLDLTPWTQSANDSPLAIGRTFGDATASVYLTPTAKGGTSPESLDVTVNIGPFAGNLPPTASLTASASQVAKGTAVTFTATATDPNGDGLSYFWDFGDLSLSTNSPTQVRSWSTDREVVAHVTVSDMKGGVAAASSLVRVGSPTAQRISGAVKDGSNGQGVENVRVAAGGRFTWTDSSGGYNLVGVSPGSYTVSAVKAGWTLTPSGFSNPVVVGASGVYGVNFTASRATYFIGGRVTSAGVGAPGVTVSAGTYSAVTNASGDYLIGGVPNGSYALTASAPGRSFEPLGFSNPVLVNGFNLSGRNFYELVFDVSGEVSGAAGPHTVTDGTRVAQTALSAGKWVYTLAKVPPGSWNLWAAAPNLTITPSFTNPVAVTNTNLAGKNFAATGGTSYLIRGTITEGPKPLPGAAVSDGTRGGATDSAGAYVIVGVPPGTYTVTPSKPGYTFAPATLSVTIASADSTGNDFAVLNPNDPPTVAVPPHVAENPVSGSSVTLNTLGADDDGEQNLTYTWRTLFGPAAVSFSRNGANSAKSTQASFTQAGGYSFEVTLEDLGGLKATAGVSVLVAQTPTALSVSPQSATVEVGSERQFAASLSDQFGGAIDFGGLADWSVSGGGTIGATGKLTATAPGDWVVTALAEGKSGTAQVKVVVGPVPRIVQQAAASPNPVAGDATLLTVLADDDEGEANLTYSWSAIAPIGPVTFKPNGGNAAKTSVATFAKEGTYNLQVEAKDQRGLSASSFVTVVSARGLSRLEVTPQDAAVAPGGTVQFSARGLDQTGAEVSPAPAVDWSASGGGQIDSSGLFTAGAAEGTFTVTAQSGLESASVPVKVVAAVEQPPPPPPDKPKGCGCGSAGGLAPFALVLLLGLGRRGRGAAAALLASFLAACNEGRLVENPPSSPRTQSAGPAVLRSEVGEVQSGYPNDQERMLHVLVNQARHSAQTPNGNECGDWTSEVGPNVKKVPLVWEHPAGVGARYTARHLAEIGCFQHESCCELGDAGAGAVACLSAGSCSGTGCNKTCDAGSGASAQSRFLLFGFGSFSGENIAQGQGSAYDAWCAFMQSDSNRQAMYAQHTQFGAGAFDSTVQGCPGWYWVQAFGNAPVTPSRIPAASAMFRPPNPANTSALYFASSYYDSSGKSPLRSVVVVNGHCFDLEKAWGFEDNGTYEAHFLDPDVLPDGCHPYYFLFLDGDGGRHTYPTVGSLQVALGATSNCPVAYDPSPQKAADCETGVQDCIAGAQRSCYTADQGTLKFGECRQGYQVCKSGFWSACRDMIGPFPEACDGLDNDCDGQTDEGNPGGNASCTVPAERGPCKAGKMQCVSGRLQCLSVQAPQTELCDGVDNDCDGVVDDGFPMLSCGLGECFRTAVGCESGQPGSCTPGAPEAELLDFKDNDCNGLVDDGFDCRQPDGGGVGRVRSCFSYSLRTPDGGLASPKLPCKPGLQACQADAGWGVCVGEVGPSPEVCDGVDNDCDTLLDENDELGWERCGTGACVTYGQKCRLGSPNPCTPKAPAAEVCNGSDDNCDGTVDEGCSCRIGDSRACYTGRPVATRDAGVCHGGARLCVDGGYSGCVGEVTPSQEYCDSRDEDCNGKVDDACLELPDAGTDAGEDAGTPSDEDAGQPDAGDGPPKKKGCGCSGGGGTLPFVVVAMLSLAAAARSGRSQRRR